MKYKNPIVFILCMLGFYNLHAGTPMVPKQFINHKDWNFVENKGQLNNPPAPFEKGESAPINDIRYYGHSGGVYLYCKPGMIEFVFTKAEKESDQISEATSRPAGFPLPKGAGGFGREQVQPSKIKTNHADLVLVGSNPSTQIIASDQQEYYENYYTANMPEEGITNVHTYKTITYKEIYPHIDMVIRAKEGGMKYEFVVYPGGKVSDIQIQWEGIENIKKLKDSKIEYDFALGNMTESAPFTYQGIANVGAGLAPAQAANIGDKTSGRLGTRKGSPYNENAETKIESQFTIKKNNIIGFKTAAYDKTKPLVIDPTLVWGTYFGGDNSTKGMGLACDKSGNIYITGTTSSANGIATAGAYQTASIGYGDAFLAKFSSSGGLIWATYYGGTYSDVASGICVDAKSNIYITGYTGSVNGMATSGAYQTSYGGGQDDAFLAKFGSSGTRLWATYYGGSDDDEATGVSTDVSGNIYITGFTQSNNDIATSGAYQSSLTGFANNGGDADAFLAKFSGNGVIQWATYYGGSGVDQGFGVSTDKAGNVYITGSTTSKNNIATYGAFQSSYGGVFGNAFLAKFNSSGGLSWATYYGSHYGSTIAECLSTDVLGNIYISGSTDCDSGIATSGAYQTSNSGGTYDAFLGKFNSSGTRLWATYYGGNQDNEAKGLTTDSLGNVYLTGVTYSTSGIATLGAYRTSIGGDEDAFLAKFSSSGNRVWATYYGGIVDDFCKGISVGLSAGVYICGWTQSTSGIATSGAFQTSNTATGPGGGEESFLAKFSFKYNTDAGISSILNPKNYFCPDTQAVYVQLHNYGTSNLDSVRISLSSNGKPITVYHWKGNLMPDSSVSVPIGRFLFPVGKDTLKSWTSNPNGVTDSVPENDTSTSIVTVLTLPSVPISPDKSICTNSTDTIGTTAVVSNLYSWTSKPSGFHSSLPRAVVSPTVKTTYYVTVTSTITGCSNSDSVTISLIPLPKVNTGPAETICEDSVITIGAASVNGLSYSWTSDPTGFSSTISKPYITPTKTTTYDLTVTDNKTGCSNSDSVVITVNPAPIVNAGSNATICAGSSVVIGDTESKNYTYNWISIPYGFSSTITEPTVSPGKNITYYLYATNPKTGCMGFNTVTITVNPLPVPGIDSTHYTICTGTHIAIGINAVADIAYSWTSQPAGFTSTQSNPIVNPAGNTIYFLTETNTKTGCSSNNSSKVTVTIPKAPVSSPGFNQTICFGNIAVLGADPLAGLTYSWTSDPPGFTSSSPKAGVKPDVTTTYYLTVKNSIGCTDLGAVTVKVNPLPVVNPGLPQTVCSGTAVQLGSLPVSGDTYSWTSDPPGFKSSISNPIDSPYVTTEYYVKGTIDSTGCTNSDSVKITVIQRPHVQFTVKDVNGFEYQFNVNSPNYLSWQYHWDFGDLSSTSPDTVSGYSVTHFYSNNGTYKVSLTVSLPGLCTEIDSYVVVVNLQFGLNIFPNPFELQTDINYVLVNPGHVRISLVDELGQELGILLDEQVNQGKYNTYFDAALWKTRPAMYFVLFQLDDKLIVKKIIQLDSIYH